MLEEPFFEAVKNGWPDLMKAKAAFFSAIALVVTISAVATYGLCTHDIDSANHAPRLRNRTATWQETVA